MRGTERAKTRKVLEPGVKGSNFHGRVSGLIYSDHLCNFAWPTYTFSSVNNSSVFLWGSIHPCVSSRTALKVPLLYWRNGPIIQAKPMWLSSKTCWSLVGVSIHHVAKLNGCTNGASESHHKQGGSQFLLCNLKLSLAHKCFYTPGSAASLWFCCKVSGSGFPHLDSRLQNGFRFTQHVSSPSLDSHLPGWWQECTIPPMALARK